MLITVDGPAGVGKGTLARKLAEKMGYAYLDTGLLFRQLALYLHKQGIPGEDEDAVKAALRLAPPSFSFPDKQLRTDDVSQMASKISVYPAVRAFQLKRQKDFVTQHKGCAVLDGRDLGAYAFPEADKKIFLDARAAVRAERRLQDLRNQGIDGDYQALFTSIQARDHRDRTRAVAPLKAAQDALVIDTSDLGIQEVLEKSLEFIASS